MPTSYEDQVSSLNPVIWFKFDESTATNNSVSSGSKTPTLVNNNSGITNKTSDVSNKGIDFGTTLANATYLTGAVSSNQFTGMSDGVFTLEWWIKSNTIGTSSNQVIWNIVDFNDNNRHLGLYLRGTGFSNTGRLTYFTLRSSTGYQETISSIRLDDNKWHHIAIAQNGNTTRMYIDGVLDTTKTDWTWTSFSFDNSSNVRTLIGTGFGAYSPYNTNSENYRGALDEYSIYSTELSAATILSNYFASNVADRELPAPFTASALMTNEIVSASATKAVDEFTGSAEFVQPVISGNAQFLATPINASADSGDHKVIHLHFRNFVRTDAFVQGVDAYYNLAEIAQDHQNTNYWNDAEQHIVTIQNTANASDIKVLFKPDLNNLTANDVHDVLMFVAGMNNVTGKLVWKRITQAFNLATVTWHNQPTSVIAQDDDIEYTFYNNGTHTEIPITELYKDLLQNTNYGFSVEFKDIKTVNLDMDNYGINLDIYTYSQPINIDLTADLMEVTAAIMVDSLTDTTSDVSAPWLTADASAEFVMPTISFDKNLSVDPMTASAEFVNPAISGDIVFDQTSMTASAEFAMPQAGLSTDILAVALEASAEIVQPALILDFNYLQDHITVFAESGDHLGTADVDLLVMSMDASAELVMPVITSVTLVQADAATANAEFVNPALQLDVNISVPVFNGNTEIFAEPIISTQISVSIGFNSLEASALIVMPSISAETIYAHISFTASSEFVDPMIVVSDEHPATAMISSALMVNPVISGDALFATDDASALAISPDAQGGIWDGYAAEVMEAKARLGINVNRSGSHSWNPWSLNIKNVAYIDDNLWKQEFLNSKEWSCVWQNVGKLHTEPRDTVYIDDLLPSNTSLSSVIRGSDLEFWSNTDTAFYNFIDYGPGNDAGWYALKNLHTVALSSNSFPNLPNVEYYPGSMTAVYPLSGNQIRVPFAQKAQNVGTETGTDYQDDMATVRQFSYEFLIKPQKLTGVLTSGSVAEASETTGEVLDNPRLYTTEIVLNQGKIGFNYIISYAKSGELIKEYYIETSQTIPLNQWTHIAVQTNKNDGKYVSLFDNDEQVQYLVDPITLNNDKFFSIEIFINGDLVKKAPIDYPDLLDANKEISIGNVMEVAKRYGGTKLSQNPNTGEIFQSSIFSAEDEPFIGSLGGMILRPTSAIDSKIFGPGTGIQSSSLRLEDDVVTLSSKSMKIMANLALRKDLTFANVATGSAQMVQPQIITNTKKVLRLYWLGDSANQEMFGVNTNTHDVVTYSVINNISTDNDLLFNADKAFAGGYTNPDTVSTEIITSPWRNNSGYKRFINIQSDVSEYADIDAIVFMDYPDDGIDWNNLMPGYAPQWISDQYDLFLSSLKTAMQDGKGLFISSSRLAKDLKIVKAIQEVSQEVEASVSPSDPFNDDLGDKHYDASRNNKYRIVGIEDDLTSLASFIMTDVIAHTGDVSDDYHIKYANRPNGLNIGDKFIIPSLPLMPSQLSRDTAGDTSNRIGENTLEVFNESDILAGKAIAKLGDTNYVTTIILEPGDLLDGQIINSKVIVNCVEDGLAMGLEEYNQGKIQVVSVNDDGESSTTIQWQYSTSRTKKQLSEMNSIVSNLNTYGQTYPTQGGGGGIVQSPTHSSGENIRSKFDKSNNTFSSGIYYDVNSEKFDLDTIPVYSMTYRGINWLLNPTDRTGKFVGQSSALAQAEFKNPTTTAIIVDPLPAVNKIVTATPMAANGVIVTNIRALFGNANSIVLTLHHQDVITLYITKERL